MSRVVAPADGGGLNGRLMGETGVRPTDGPLHYLGRIVRFSTGRGVGTLRSDTGRQVDFDVRFCEVAGAGHGNRARQAVVEGMRVAFDVGWTSRGLRVTWMRRLEEPELSERPSGSEGEIPTEKAPDQDGQGRDVE